LTGSIVYDIIAMDIHERIERLRRGAANVYTRQLVSLARAANVTVATGGKHQIKLIMPGMGHMTIPDHPGPRGKGLVLEVLDRIESYLLEQEEKE
jgi:hypothetical protein